MPQEKPGNPDWRSRIAELDALPGEPSDMPSAWKKLHNRMEKKNTSKKPAWYWIAAACLALILAVFLMPPKTGKTGIVQEHREQSPLPHMPLTDTLNNIKNTYAPKNTHIPTELTSIYNRNNSGSTKNRRHTPAAHDPFLIAATKKVQDSFPAPLTSIPLPDSIITAPVALAAPKKKLHVVHINELGAAGDIETWSHNNERPDFQTTGHGRNNFSAYTFNHPSDNILKIKLSPTN